MTVNVTAVNDAPTVVNDTDSVTEGGTVIAVSYTHLTLPTKA